MARVRCYVSERNVSLDYGSAYTVSCSENECRCVLCRIAITPHTILIMLEESSPELSVAVEAVRTSAGVRCHVAITPQLNKPGKWN